MADMIGGIGHGTSDAGRGPRATKFLCAKGRRLWRKRSDVPRLSVYSASDLVTICAFGPRRLAENPICATGKRGWDISACDKIEAPNSLFLVDGIPSLLNKSPCEQVARLATKGALTFECPETSSEGELRVCLLKTPKIFL